MQSEEVNNEQSESSSTSSYFSTTNKTTSLVSQITNKINKLERQNSYKTTKISRSFNRGNELMLSSTVSGTRSSEAGDNLSQLTYKEHQNT